MALSMSVSALSVGNISIRDVPIAEAYETVFGDSLKD